MRRIVCLLCLMTALVLTGCMTSNMPAATTRGSAAAASGAPSPVTEEDVMEERIIVVKGQAGIEVRFALNESQAAADLWSQLPLTVEVEDFSTNEKTFYPDRLDTSDAPLARGGAGSLAYYEPWGDVVMFYDSYNGNSSLYALGDAIENADEIGLLTGTITVERA